jgi:hypothetical protein
MTGSAEIVAAATATGADAAEIGFGGNGADVGAADIDVWFVNDGCRGGRPFELATILGAGGLGGSTPGGGLKGCAGGPDGGGR